MQKKSEEYFVSWVELFSFTPVDVESASLAELLWRSGLGFVNFITLGARNFLFTPVILH
jgi:hypothetical protein